MQDHIFARGAGQSGQGHRKAEPDFATWLFYLDCGDDTARLAPLLRWWYDEACRLLLPFVHPAGAAAPTASVSAFEQDATGRSRRRRPARWADGLTEDLYQLSAHWFDVAPTTVASELDLYLYRFADRRHVKLQISVGFEDRPRGLPQVVPALVELARVTGDMTDPAYGEIVVNAGTLAPATLLDAALGRSDRSSAEASRVHLRGYEWVTICPKELAVQLGGPDRVWSSGAFAEVRALKHGGLLLRATDDPDAYGADEVRAIFRVLAPVLPPGKPGKPPAVPPVGAGGAGMLSGVPRVLAGDPGSHDLSRVVFADARTPNQQLQLGPGLPRGGSDPGPRSAPAGGVAGPG